MATTRAETPILQFGQSNSLNATRTRKIGRRHEIRARSPAPRQWSALVMMYAAPLKSETAMKVPAATLQIAL
jgi:hypothetical protein